MQKNFKITNKKQMEKLPLGCNNMQLKGTWDKFTEQLNSLGPPIKSTKEWQRAWTHYKANLKRKLAANKRNFQTTDRGPSTEISLSLLEQSTVELVSMQTQVNPNGSANLEDSDGAELTFRPEEPSQTIESTEPQLPKIPGRKGRTFTNFKNTSKKSGEDLRNVEKFGK